MLIVGMSRGLLEVCGGSHGVMFMISKLLEFPEEHSREVVRRFLEVIEVMRFFKEFYVQIWFV